MSGEKIQFEERAQDARPEAEKRQVSTIGFPYLDLDAAIEVAKAMHETRGHGPMEAADLAATLNQTISGNFRLKTGTAKMFGLTEREGRDQSKLSGLGLRIIEEQTEAEARSEAFMQVPLYSAIFDMYKGQRLPPPKALEREMEGLGASSKQTDKARQVFERSARQAGFFAKDEDRLVKPYLDGGTHEEGQREDDSADKGGNQNNDNGGNGGGDGPRFHPFVRGLLDELPGTKEFTDWSIGDQAEWLNTAAGIFKLMSKQKGRIEVSVKNTNPDQ